MKKLLGLVLGLALLTAACGPGSDEDNDPGSYRPIAYGENGNCYYLDEADLNGNKVPDEVDKLREEGLCQTAWRPYYMPEWWLIAYAPYYFSPAYYDVYVPSSRRPTYISRARAFEKSHGGYIEAARNRALWYNTKTRTPVPGERVDYKTSSFGGGKLRAGGFSSGMRCVGASFTDRVKYVTLIANPFLAQSRGGGFSGGSRTVTSPPRVGGSPSGGTSINRTNTPWKPPSFGFGSKKSSPPKPAGCR